jgi:6-phosphogluconolactonase (cycloisomerase 2 family)
MDSGTDSEASDSNVLQLHVGTYARAGGVGLYPLAGEAMDRWTLGEADERAPNASFGTYSARLGLYYLLDERTEGALGVFRRSASGWEPLARVPTHGAEPCYVALDQDEAWLAVANYGSGCVALFRLDADTGLPGEPPKLLLNHGHGPVPDRQAGPHAHCALFSPDGKWLYHVDLGTDEVLAWPFDAAQGVTDERVIAYAAPAGTGPRHLVLHPRLPLAYLISELASTLTVLGLGDGSLSARQSISTLPVGFSGESLGGHLTINANGDRIYVSNRGHDSVAVFAADESGHLSLIQHVPSGGASPRLILLLEAERHLIVANEEGDSVTTFQIAIDGTLAQRAEIAVPGAAFLLNTENQPR